MYTFVFVLDCSGIGGCGTNGVCVEDGTCVCKSGFYGDDCSLTDDPHAPPGNQQII